MTTVLRRLARVADAVVSASMLIVGIYLFFIEREFVNGSIVLGAGALYSMSMLGALMARYYMEKDD